MKSSVTPQKLAALRRALDKAEIAEDTIKVSSEAAGLEAALKKAGLYQPERVRPWRELYLDARCELGDMLRKMVRGTGPGRGKKKERSVTSFSAELERLHLAKPRAIECQRASCLPLAERRKVYKEAERQEILPTLEWLIDDARPYWYAESRKTKHRSIAQRAREQRAPETFGPFPLIYADPPWTFDTYSEKGLEKTPTQHYPTMTDTEIINMKIFGKRVSEIVCDDAALLLWCTSSNIQRAIDVMEGWGFEYKSQAVWVKLGADDRPISGMGLVFLNQHEVLLYGTHKGGKMPGPQYQPPSVFLYRRGKHSAKPPEVRGEIEKMYPDFDENTRLELFSRDSVAGWTHFGLEANIAKQAAE